MKIFFLYIIFLLAWAGIEPCLAQNRPVVQFSGIIIGGDSAYGIPGVYLYVSKSGRGTVSNHVGYFSLPVLVGDTVLIKSIGFKLKKYIVPPTEEKLSVIIELLADTAYLPMVEIFPWPTEKLFKEAFLSLDLPNAEKANAEKNLSARVMQRMMLNMPDDGSLNHQYFMTQQIQRSSGRFIYPTLSLLDPFAWSRFLNQVKKGGLKHQDEKDFNKEDDDPER